MARGSLCLVLGLALNCTPALAHRLQVFAFAEGDRIQGSAYFAGGGAAIGARVRVLDPQGQLLAQLTPDGLGAFSYRVLAAQDHLVVAETGDGHRAEWRVRAAELSPTQPAAPRVPEPSGPAQNSLPGPDLAAGRDADLEHLVGRAVARQIGPLREEFAAAQGRAALRDVLGGIGYILGIAGLLAWWRSRQARRSP